MVAVKSVREGVCVSHSYSSFGFPPPLAPLKLIGDLLKTVRIWPTWLLFLLFKRLLCPVLTLLAYNLQCVSECGLRSFPTVKVDCSLSV